MHPQVLAWQYFVKGAQSIEQSAAPDLSNKGSKILEPPTKLDPSKIGFSDLPGELRNQIYAYILSSKQSIEISKSRAALYTQAPDLVVSLTQISKKFRREAYSVFLDNLFTVVVPENGENDSPPHFLKTAEKILIVINYHQLACRYLHFANQLRYLMETAKLLSQNESLREVEFSFGFASTAAPSLETLRYLMVPLISHMRHVPVLKLTRRRWCPDGSWHIANDFNVLPEGYMNLLRYKWGDRSKYRTPAIRGLQRVQAEMEVDLLHCGTRLLKRTLGINGGKQILPFSWDGKRSALDFVRISKTYWLY